MTTLALSAQVGSPFDLTPRLSAGVSESGVRPTDTFELPTTPVRRAATAPANPFDLVGRSDREMTGLAEQPIVAEADQEPQGIDANIPIVGSNDRKLFDALLAVGLLLLLAVSFAMQGGSLQKMWGALGNDNLLGRMQREQRWGGYYLWGFLGAVSLGAFLFVSIREVGAGLLPNTDWLLLDVFMLGTVGLILLKLLALTVLRAVFPLERPVSSYRTIIFVWVAVLGVMLFPLTVLTAFASPVLAKAAAYLGLGICVLAYAFRALRALTVNAREITSYPLHFFMYLCALEIGPVAVAYKLLTG